jgi:ATP-dependent RNA helicase DHX37/DHR1
LDVIVPLNRCQDGKKNKGKEDPKMSKTQLKKLQKLEVRLPTLPFAE